ncbi:MAG: TerC family protein [Actinomycetota bacterium]|nr:TerC family protein [Actinomycetota bacterium]
MEISATVWSLTIGVTIAVLLFDVLIVGRRPHEPSMKECTVYISIYTALAVVFGLWMWVGYGGRYAGEFFAGWLTEYSLSVDNLFVFIIIMGALGVPRKYQQEALLVGIILALVFRAVFIALGAVAINQISWIFYVFGAFLIYTAVQLARHDDDEDDYEENRVIKMIKSRVPSTDEWHGLKLFIRENGKRVMTPMLIVIVALGSTDILFALDSIPAIYGLTQEPYLVLTANIFALMGLRQLYFLLGGLLDRLIYLSYGLAAILAFIGVKLILHALAENELPFINGGEHVEVPEIPTWLSLVVIAVSLAVTATASIVAVKKDPSKASQGSGVLDTGGGDPDADAGAATDADGSAESAGGSTRLGAGEH